MTKAITCTVIGRLIQQGWLASVYDPAPAPLWRDPRSIHRVITPRSPAAHALGARVSRGARRWPRDARLREQRGVYQDAGDAFDAAQRSIVATLPGAVYRYINSALNVLGAIIRDRIERRGLPYYETLYGLLVDRLGMASYQHSADIGGNLIASGAGFATLARLREARSAVSAERDVDGERLLPQGLGRLCADRDAYRDQLCSVLPRQHRPLIPRSPARYRVGLGRLPTSASSSCGATG